MGTRGRRYYRNRSGIVILESLVSVSVSILENLKYQYKYRNRHSLKSGTPLNDFGHFIKIFVIKLVWLWYQYRNRNRNWYFSWYQYRNRPDMGKVSVSKSVSKKLVSPAPDLKWCKCTIRLRKPVFPFAFGTEWIIFRQRIKLCGDRL